jgi:phosphate transport system ATP-binding protein
MAIEQGRTHAIDMNSILRGRDTVHEQLDISIKVENLDLYYGQKQALHGINMEIPKQRVTAYIGPSGCGKSTLLRCINRMNDLVDSARST